MVEEDQNKEEPNKQFPTLQVKVSEDDFEMVNEDSNKGQMSTRTKGIKLVDKFKLEAELNIFQKEKEHHNSSFFLVKLR